MKSEIKTKDKGIREINRLRWAKRVVLILASIMVLLVEMFNYFILGIPIFEDIVNLLFGLLIAIFLTEFGFRYLSRLQRQLNQAITNQEAAETQLHLQSAALESAANAIVITDRDGRVTWVNGAFSTLTGFSIEEVIGENLRLLKSGVHEDDFYTTLWQTINAGEVWQGELINRRKDGQLYTEEQTITPVLDDGGEISHYIAIKQDITQRKNAETSQQKYIDRLNALHQNDQAILAALSPQEIARAALDSVRQLIPAYRASVVLLDWEQEKGQILATQSSGISSIEDGDPLPISVFDIPAEVKEGQVHLVTDIEQSLTEWPSVVRKLYAEGLRSYVIVPLMVQEALLGLFYLGSDKLGAFSVEEVEIAAEIADSVAVAIQQANLYEAEQTARAQLEIQASELRDREQFLGLLNGITQAGLATTDFQELLQLFADQLGVMLEADACYLILWDETRQEALPRAAYGEHRLTNSHLTVEQGEITLTSSVLEAGHPIVVEDVLNSPYTISHVVDALPTRTMLGLPLIVGTQKLGAVLVSFDEPHQFSPSEIARCEQAAGQVALAIAKAKLFANEREQRLLAEALRDTGSALSASLDFDEVVYTLFDQINRVVPFDSASLLQVNKGRAKVTHLHGFESPEGGMANILEEISFEIASTPNLRQVCKTREPFIIDDVLTYPGWITTAITPQVRSWIGVPIMLQDQAIALLSLDKHQPGYFQPDHVQMVAAFAAQAALALHHARLYSEKVDNLTREKRLNEVIQATSATLDLPKILQLVVELAAKLVEAGGAAMALIAPDGNKLSYPYLYNLPVEIDESPVPKGKGLAWLIIEKGESIIHSCYEEHPAALPVWKDAGLYSFLGAPIVAGDDKLGALGLFSLSPERQFSERDRALAETIGRQAGIAIQNARLFEETRQRARELDLLNRIIANTASAENETQLFSIGCSELARFFDIPQAVTAVLAPDKLTITIVAECLEPGLTSLLNTKISIQDNPILKDFFLTGEPVVLADVRLMSLSSEMEAILSRRGMLSVLMVPVYLREKIVGIIGIHANYIREFSKTEIRLAKTVGEELGKALEVVRLNDRLRAHATELEKRVQERTRALAAANEQLKELDRLKSKFVSDVSHELRTPITNLGMYLDLLDHGLPDKRVYYLTTLRKEVGRLRQLVGDILDLSRLEMIQDRKIQFEPINLNLIVGQVVSVLLPQAIAAGLSLEFNPDSTMPLIPGVHNQIVQVATNLLTNAINYTKDGRILVRTFRQNGQVCLQVQDTGLGIGPEDMPHIFERFYRGQQVGQYDIPGTGLGLGIVKEIVDLHGGRIEVSSELGQGSTFQVWLTSTDKEL